MNKKGSTGGRLHYCRSINSTRCNGGRSCLWLFLFINGQTQRTEFSQAVRELELRIQDIANDAATGFGPSNGVACTTLLGEPNFSGPSPGQGANQA